MASSAPTPNNPNTAQAGAPALTAEQLKEQNYRHNRRLHWIQRWIGMSLGSWIWLDKQGVQPPSLGQDLVISHDPRSTKKARLLSAGWWKTSDGLFYKNGEGQISPENPGNPYNQLSGRYEDAMRQNILGYFQDGQTDLTIDFKKLDQYVQPNGELTKDPDDKKAFDNEIKTMMLQGDPLMPFKRLLKLHLEDPLLSTLPIKIGLGATGEAVLQALNKLLPLKQQDEISKIRQDLKKSEERQADYMCRANLKSLQAACFEVDTTITTASQSKKDKLEALKTAYLKGKFDKVNDVSFKSLTADTNTKAMSELNNHLKELQDYIDKPGANVGVNIDDMRLDMIEPFIAALTDKINAQAQHLVPPTATQAEKALRAAHDTALADLLNTTKAIQASQAYQNRHNKLPSPQPASTLTSSSNSNSNPNPSSSSIRGGHTP